MLLPAGLSFKKVGACFGDPKAAGMFTEWVELRKLVSEVATGGEIGGDLMLGGFSGEVGELDVSDFSRSFICWAASCFSLTTSRATSLASVKTETNWRYVLEKEISPFSYSV